MHVCVCDATIAAAAHAHAKGSWWGSHNRAPPPVPLVSTSQTKLGEGLEGEEGRSNARAPPPPSPLGTTEKRKKGGQTRRQGARLTGLAAGLPPQGCSGKGPPSSQSARVSNVAARLLAALPTLRSNVSLRERRKEKSH